ncbi:hypothetical protein BDA99DRAFT_555596 [Phascolomyces articulosus]|uniref:Uncharacterized protein n=1 Tax=Phascolomyces articulosus TaxID=60185 RepID=A0AAD5KN96_9FUNG|nr:hypothetical protein BDA99DRAFT_555596 [Phascolomyces articulosus]
MAQASELTNQVFTNNNNNHYQMPGKQTKQISTTGARLSNISTSSSIHKKLPTPSPSSYTFAPRWMAKANHESTTITTIASSTTTTITAPSSTTSSRPSSPTSTMTDENFPSLSTLGEEGKKKRSVWNDPNSVKRKVISPSTSGVPSSEGGGHGTDDPFAGMNTLVDYQQEIERLKALVPKVENKKRTSTPIHSSTTTTTTPTSTTTSTRPKSTGADLKQQQQQRLLWNDLRSAASSVAANRSAASSVKSSGRVSSVSPTTRSMVVTGDMSLSFVSSSSASSSVSSNASSVASDDDDLKFHPSSSQSVTDESQPSEDKEEDEQQQQQQQQHSIHMESVSTSVITEEEKARFLEFMRSWTGGWQGWDNRAMEGMRKEGSSFWTGRSSPWEPKRQSWHESNKYRPDGMTITMPTQARFTNESSFIRSEPTTPLGHTLYEPYFTDRAIVNATSKHHEELFQRHHPHHPHQPSLHSQQQHHHHQQHPYHHHTTHHHSTHHNTTTHHSQQQHQHPHQQNMRYGQQPPTTTNHYEPLGTIGDRNSARGLPRMGNGGAPFGVFVM